MSKKNPSPAKPTEEEVKNHDEMWGILCPVIRNALDMKSVSGVTYQTAYNAVYARKAFFQPQRHPQSVQLLKDSLEEECRKYLIVLSEQESRLSSQALVEHFGRSWDRWSKSANLVRQLLMYVESCGVDFDVSSMMQSMWKTTMFSKECKGNIVGVVCDIINDFRRGDPAPVDLVHSLITSLNVMDKTEAELERKKLQARSPAARYAQPAQRKSSDSNTLIKQLGSVIMQNTEAYYKELSSSLESKMKAGDAIRFVNGVFAKEKELVSTYLKSEKEVVKLANIDKLVNESLVRPHLKFFESGFPEIVLTENVELGKGIYAIFKRVNSTQELATNFGTIVGDHVRGVFEQHLDEAMKDCRKYIGLATSEYKMFNTFRDTVFGAAAEFAKALKESMTAVINDNAVVAKNIPAGSGNVEISKNMWVARTFARYVHMLMLPGKERVNEDERIKLGEEFIEIYDFLKSKKDFLDQYRNNLTGRLLLIGTVGAEIERAFLEQLKKYKGEEILSHCTSMLNDYLSRDSSVFGDFMADRLESDGKKAGKFSVQPLLCSAAWPIKKTDKALKLPERMEAVVSLYQEFFNRTLNSNGRKSVFLLHQYGTGDLFFFSAGKKYTIHGREIHLVVLPMIRSSSTITFKQIMDASGISLDEMKSHMAYLLKNGFVLAKNDEGMPKFDKTNPGTWSEGTIMKASPKFAPPKNMTEFTIAVKKEERSTNVEAISAADAKNAFNDHVQTSEANIVRIMKTRKDFSTAELFAETVQAVQRWFSVDRKLFNAALSDLIDQEIVERGESGRVKYIA